MQMDEVMTDRKKSREVADLKTSEDNCLPVLQKQQF